MRSTPSVNPQVRIAGDSAMRRAEENRIAREARLEAEGSAEREQGGEVGETAAPASAPFEIPRFEMPTPSVHPSVHESVPNPARQARETSERLYGTGSTEPTEPPAAAYAAHAARDHGGPALGALPLPTGEFIERPRMLDSSGRPLERNPRHVIGELMKGIGAVTSNEDAYAFVMGRLATGQYDRLADYIEDAVLGAPAGTLTDEETMRAKRASALARNTSEGSI